MSQATTIVPMDQMLQDAPMVVLPEPGELLTGIVAGLTKSYIIVSIQDGFLTGMISGKEIKDAHNTAKSLKVGDEVKVCVLEAENEDGLVVLSLRRASQENTWAQFIDAYQNNKALKVRPKEANKGGLLMEVDGIKGFIPVSQLAPLHYPRVNGADAAKILARLQKLVGVEFTVKIVSIDKEKGKLIFSEKEAFAEERNQALGDLKVGDAVDGTVSGIVKFGIFVAFNGLEGLVHISEIAWGHVNNPYEFAKLGDKTRVKVIGLEGDKISLSMKQLTEDPWKKITENYKVGSIIDAKISRLAQFGAFVELEGDINGLIHSSEIPGNPKDPAEVLEVGQVTKVRVIEVDPEEKRVGLSMKLEVEKKSKEEIADE